MHTVVSLFVSLSRRNNKSHASLSTIQRTRVISYIRFKHCWTHIRLDVIPGIKDKDKRKSPRLICRCRRDVLNLSHRRQRQTIILKVIRLICTLLFAGQRVLDEVGIPTTIFKFHVQHTKDVKRRSKLKTCFR
jgi:hypothetical protein